MATPLAIETHRGSSGVQQQEVWSRGPSKVRKGSARGPTSAAFAAASSALPQHSKAGEVLTSKTLGRPLEPPSPGTKMQERNTLGSPSAHAREHQDNPVVTVDDSPFETHEYEHSEQNDVWNFPMAPSSETPPDREKATSPSTPSGKQQPSQHHQQQELQEKQKREPEQTVQHQQGQQHHLEQREQQQPQQVLAMHQALREAPLPAPISPAKEETPQQRQQQPEDKTDEEEIERQQQQQQRDTRSHTERSSLRCFPIFSPESEEAVPDSPHSRVTSSSNSSSRSSSKEARGTPSSVVSWEWLGPVATELKRIQ
ncbi:hypothetical protein, conserved [Eimeria praecox]|uniref:Uncharacterized protein n=1 Tax=Eimeria praecox TaxID=51316 RepID=U6H0H8_9EIME|nr:hypothetical protein, conserved [Eimeria praecox]